MSNIAEGIKHALEQSRLEREQTKQAEINGSDESVAASTPAPMGLRLKEAAEVILAADEEDVTVRDLRNLMTTVNQ